MANATVNLSLIKSGYVRQDSPGTVYPTSSSGVYLCSEKKYYGSDRRLYMAFEHMPDNIKNRRVYGIRMKTQIGWNAFHAYACGDFDPATLCYSNAPKCITINNYASLWGEVDTVNRSMADRWLAPLSTLREEVQYAYSTNLLKAYALYLDTSGSDDSAAAGAKTVLSGGNAPYLEITYDDSVDVLSQITVKSGPTSGYVSPYKTKYFSWSFETLYTEEYVCGGVFTQQSAAIKWRVSGGDTWNTINADGSTQNITVPANTFPAASTIEWYLTGTDTVGTTSQTVHYSFSTAAGSAIATAVSPMNSVEDGSQAVVLRWILSSEDAQAPAYVDLQWKKSTDSTWTSLLSHDDAVEACTVSGGIFPAGEIQWRVRAYNVDDTAGSWSTAGGSYPSFICVAAPDAPQGLEGTNVPMTTVSWQSSGQEAYEIELDGVSVVKDYGPFVNSWTADRPLEDGTHVIRVRLQGVYGLWSAWAETSVDVSNQPDGTLSIAGKFDVDALLQAELHDSSETMEHVRWYRDGKYIALTGPDPFIDRMVLGEHSYFAEIWMEDGNYIRSNTITGIMKSCETRIASAEYGSSWLLLNLSENSDSVQAFTWSKASSLRHVRGSAFPVVEIGENEDLTASYDCAFTTVQEARQFEELKGRIVIIKSRGGQVLIGAMTNLVKQVKDFYITYSFSVQRIHWEDFVSYENN